jgi:Predicted membrane protein (DUF2306)
VITLSALGVAAASLRYLAGGDMTPPPLRLNFLDHPLAFWTHITCGGVALAVGPWQFLKGLRRRARWAHRGIGVVYATCCVVGGLAGLTMAPGSSGGLTSAIGFSVLACLWIGTTLAAVIAILKGDVTSHGRWMRLSFALTFAGVTLRVMLPFALVDLTRFSEVYAAISWLCWAPNLVVAEAINRRLERLAET